MPRSYKHIKQHKEEIMQLKEEGLSHREIGERLGFSKEQVKGFVKRSNQENKKLEAGQAVHLKGRPPKDYEVTEDMKINELKYIIARKDSKIKRLEMENELMRDFLSLTERK